MKDEAEVKLQKDIEKDELIVITGAGGFIAGALTRYFHEKGFTRIRAIDRKPLPDWYQRVPGVECLSMDLSEKENAIRAVEGAVEVYNLAADMGGMGFIERFRIQCLRSILINTHLLEAAYRAGTKRYFFSSSACAYNTTLQQDPHVRALKESDAYPAMAERGYGWEKLMSEMFCQEYWAERGLETHIARFHNVYGSHGTWDGGREKAPAAICRKVIQAKDTGANEITIWGDGTQTRSYTYIEDCVRGIDMIVQFPDKPSIVVSGASGGERSVSAVAFIFALKEFSPASFYVFDEVDAHLDAFHTTKLADLFREESEKTQFIVVTLKPEMVNKAEKVYGVYERNGVSAVISAKFMEEAR